LPLLLPTKEKYECVTATRGTSLLAFFLLKKKNVSVKVLAALLPNHARAEVPEERLSSSLAPTFQAVMPRRFPRMGLGSLAGRRSNPENAPRGTAFPEEEKMSLTIRQSSSASKATASWPTPPGSSLW
jgi:hypothetical protein